MERDDAGVDVLVARDAVAEQHKVRGMQHGEVEVGEDAGGT